MTIFCLSKTEIIIEIGASPLEPFKLIALRALVLIHLLQADTRATPCRQPLCVQASAAAWLVAYASLLRPHLCHSQIPELSCDRSSSMIKR